MAQYVHGGDVYTYAEKHGGVQPLDLSANINPFGIPKQVMQAMHEAVAQCGRYPDPWCRAARRSIAAAAGISPDWLYCGNGAADVLDRLAAAIAPKTALLTAPAFAEYARSLNQCKLEFHFLQAEEDFAVTERILDQITPQLDAVYLCNPNNPTGRTIDQRLMHEILQKCRACGAWLVVDECFQDFLIDAAEHTLTDMLYEFPRLILLRAYTKMFAVPGVRFGWCMTANMALIDALYSAGQPWNVSVIAQACAAAAAKETVFAHETAKQIHIERMFLTDGLRARGTRVFPAQANFILFYSHDVMLHQKLESHGILIRNCANYTGLKQGYYRVAVKMRVDTERFLEALDQIRKEER